MSFSTNHAFNPSWQDKLIGLVIVLGIIASVLWWIINLKTVDTRYWLPVEATLSESYGIGKDTPIKVSGIAIGKVQNIELTDKAQVRLKILLNRQYMRFFHTDSRLEIDSAIALNSMLSGNSLSWHIGLSEDELTAGASVPVTEPQSMNALFQKLDLEGLLTTLSNIMANLDRVSQTLSNNQQAINLTLQNLANSSDTLSQSLQKLPPLLDAGNFLISNVNQAVNNIDPQITHSLQNWNRTLNDSQQLMQNSNHLISNLNETATLAPDTLMATNTALYEVTKLTKTLQSHWLFASPNENPETKTEVPIIYPADSTLYSNQEQTNTSSKLSLEKP
ncbi:MlaD family protein [Paraglaciecola hydrolytica]|uniref:Mce/MlaD domain-containing protein n=1 Tax=Paraglaciecola hydrolytica TaxID=1799789 RepID=A0A136A1Z5_9ALTE|nr:MlaD family protein [Paraglaciecola hydrolytica]KXI29241.1 hypothetical protein AX660_13930 [Paraglaciecola hydrolytica]